MLTKSKILVQENCQMYQKEMFELKDTKFEIKILRGGLQQLQVTEEIASEPEDRSTEKKIFFSNTRKFKKNFTKLNIKNEHSQGSCVKK